MYIIKIYYVPPVLLIPPSCKTAAKRETRKTIFFLFIKLTGVK